MDGCETQHVAENSPTSAHQASQLERREDFPSAVPVRRCSWHNNSPAPCWDTSPVFSLYALGGRAAGWGGGTQSWDDAFSNQLVSISLPFLGGGGETGDAGRHMSKMNDAVGCTHQSRSQSGATSLQSAPIVSPQLHGLQSLIVLFFPPFLNASLSAC